MSLTQLRTHRRIPSHEDALQREELCILTESSTTPTSSHTYFVSQSWENLEGGHLHPDNHRNTKLRWLQHLGGRLGFGLSQPDMELWIWFDFMSIPQRDRVAKKKAIASLCYYTQLCTRFLALVRDEEEWSELYGGESIAQPKACTAAVTGGSNRGGKNHQRPGTLETYLSRGWCRLELVAALAPKKFPSGAWRPGPRNLSMRYHTDPDAPGEGPRITAEFLLNPTEG